MLNETDNVMQEHELWNCKYIGAGSLPMSYRESGKAGYAQFAKDASKVGKIFSQNGFKFLYHNHHFEFQKEDGMTYMETLFNESIPEDFDFEIDTFWVQTGGSDPAAWIKKCNGRIHVVHLKDMVIKNVNGEIKQIMAEVGEGNLNWPAIINACKEAGVEWYVVEQDTCQRDPFDSLKISLNNLKSWGLK
jgi:sugar phosphate isomerase/epimerase